MIKCQYYIGSVTGREYIDQFDWQKVYSYCIVFSLYDITIVATKLGKFHIVYYLSTDSC